MDPEVRKFGTEAIRRLEKVIGTGSEVSHNDVQEAVTGVVDLRNQLVIAHREGRIGRDRLEEANALVSLAYGAEFPLTGFHIQRFEQTRDGLQALIAQG